MSRKRGESLIKLMKAYGNLYKLSLNLSAPRSTLDEFISITNYLHFIRERFIDNPSQGDNISLAAIQEITRTINNFIKLRKYSDLEPIQDILDRHPYSFMETVYETIHSYCEAILPSRGIIRVNPEILNISTGNEHEKDDLYTSNDINVVNDMEVIANSEYFNTINTNIKYSDLG